MKKIIATPPSIHSKNSKNRVFRVFRVDICGFSVSFFREVVSAVQATAVELLSTVTIPHL